MNAYWRAANYLSVGQLYLYDNPQSASEHPHGLSDTDYDSLFTTGKHIIFAFHGYPWLIHRLTYRRANRDLHVRGYNEEGTMPEIRNWTWGDFPVAREDRAVMPGSPRVPGRAAPA